MRKILYIGGFEMPDKNAAAQRVLSIGKALRECGYIVKFYGLTKDNVTSGTVDGFEYESYSYPKSTLQWFSYASGGDIITYIDKEQPDYIFTYNYPAIAQNKVINYCHKKGIKVVGDITEWYKPHSLVKSVDTYLRMHYSNKQLDGIIAISTYLSEYYKNQYQIQLPPLVDKNESKWTIDFNQPLDDKIHLVYMGTGSKKDRLDKIVNGIAAIDKNPFILEIIGIDEARFKEIYGVDIYVPECVKFWGHLPHSEAVKHLKESDFQIFFRDNVRVNNAGFPTKLVESISAGIPVVTNKISNITDYIADGDNSFIIEDSDEVKIYNVLKRVSQLNRDDIQSMKGNLDVNKFDYHQYVDIIREFMQPL